MGDIGRRRSDRVEVKIPVEVGGLSADGQEFWELTYTQRVSRHGAAVLLRETLAPEQDITIRKLDTRNEAEFRIIGLLGKFEDMYLYGVALENPEQNFWDIEFPPLTEAEKAASRVLLECAKCRSLEVAHLDEIETDVFRAVSYLARPCKRCSSSTIWKAATNAPPPKPAPFALEPPQAAPEEKVDQRKHPRLRVRLSAAIRRIGAAQEMVQTVDVSRGGLCFECDVSFELGERIEVATHYTPGEPAIFIPARIVYCRAMSGKRGYRYGVEYLAESRGELVR
jgi:hypothetical protein